MTTVHSSFADEPHTPSCTYNPYHVVESFTLGKKAPPPNFASLHSARGLISLTEPDSMQVVQDPSGVHIVEYYSIPLRTLVHAAPSPLESEWRLASWTVSGITDEEGIRFALSVAQAENPQPMLEGSIACPSVLDEGERDNDYRDGHAIGAAILSFAQESELTATVKDFHEE